MITIEKAAIQYQEKVYTGWRHAQIGQDMLKAGVCKRPYPGGPAQGFVTSEGKFVDREEARKIAEAAGQGQLPLRRLELFSEDLWTSKGIPLHGCSSCHMFYLYSGRGKVCPLMPCHGGQFVKAPKKSRIRQ